MWAFLFFAGLLSGWWGAQSSVAPPAPSLVPQKTSTSEGSSMMMMMMAARHDGESQGARTLPFALAIAARYDRIPEYYAHPASPESRPSTRSHLEPYRNSLGRAEDDASSRGTSRTRIDAANSDHLESVRNLYRTYRADDVNDGDEANDESDATSRFRHDSLPRLRYVGGNFRRSSEGISHRDAEDGIGEGGSSGPVSTTLVYTPRSQQARQDSWRSDARTEKDESSPLEPHQFDETIDDYRDNVELDNFMNYQVTPSSSREQPSPGGGSEESAAREAINFASDRDRIATNNRIAMENLRDYRRRHQHRASSNDEYEAADSDEDTPRDIASNPVTGITALALYPTVDEPDLASNPRHATTDALGVTSPFSMESSMERPRVSRAAVNQNAKNRNRTKQNSRREQRRQGRNNNNNNNNKDRRGQNWCPEADVGNRAYRAPTVFEGKARSMSSVRKPGSNYAVTFEVKQVYKSQPGFQPLLQNDSVRLHFRDKVPGKSTLCGSNSEATGQDSSGTIRANIKRGKVYLVFVDRVGPRNFTILYEPMIRSKKNAQAVQAVIRPDYVRAVTLSELRDAVAGLRDRVKLVCRTRGSPPPRVHWFKDGKPLHPRRGLRIQHKRRRSKVVIASARAEDSGEYKCVAESFSGNRAALAAELLVTHAPETTTATWPRQEAPCPIKDDFCMNGGTCLFFETVGEPACRCAEGFTGLRCETKDVISTGSVYNRHRAPFSCKLGLSTSYYC